MLKYSSSSTLCTLGVPCPMQDFNQYGNHPFTVAVFTGISMYRYICLIFTGLEIGMNYLPYIRLA